MTPPNGDNLPRLNDNLVSPACTDSTGTHLDSVNDLPRFAVVDRRY